MDKLSDFLVVKDKTCPHCGAESLRIALDIKNGGVVLAFQPAEIQTRNHWRCPHCAKDFCAHCFTPDYSGNGTTIHCPHCKERLRFPATLRYPIASLN